MKFDSQQFLKDIGLDFDVTMLSPKPTAPPVPNNLVTFFSHKSMRMDCPRTAAYIHIKNLIATYGVDIVKEAVDVVTST